MPGDPLIVEKKRLAFKAIAAVAGIDIHGKVHGLCVHDKAIVTDHFLEFLGKLRRAHADKGTVHVFLDNLRLHKTHAVKRYAEENDINLVFNGSYSSEYNPVERLWLFAKRKFAE